MTVRIPLESFDPEFVKYFTEPQPKKWPLGSNPDGFIIDGYFELGDETPFKIENYLNREYATTAAQVHFRSVLERHGVSLDSLRKGSSLISSDVLANSRRYFDRIDRDDDAFLSASELRMSNPGIRHVSIDGPVRALRRNVAEIEELSNDEWGDENDGISQNDLDELEKLDSSEIRNALVSKMLSDYWDLD